MTTEEWSRVRKALTQLGNIVTMKIDGYKVQVQLERISTYRNAIAIYVDGTFKGKWLTEDCEERRRFIQMRKKSLWTPKKLKELGISKKEQKKWLAEKYVYYQPTWTSFGALRGHLIGNNENIELMKISWED